MSMTDAPASPGTSADAPWPRLWRKAVSVLLALWIFGIGAFFVIRFTSVVYDANREALGRILDSLAN